MVMDRDEKESRRMDRQGRKEERRSSMRDRARKRAEERESQGGGGTKYNLPENVTFYSPKKHSSLDIIPYAVSVDNHPEDVPKGELWYQRTVFVHYGVGAEEKSYLCLKTIKKKCPICEERATLLKDQNADEDLVKALKSRERELFNVYDRDDPDKGVQFWDISNYNFGAKLEEELREGRPEWAGFAEPIDGFTLKVRFSEEQIGKNKFMQASRIDFEERKNIDKKILAAALDLDKILKVLSYEQLEKIFLGVDSDAENGDGGKQQVPDENERPRTRVDRDDVKDKDEEVSQRSRDSKEEKHSETKSASASSRRESRADAKNTLVCPVEGGVFGRDTDEFDECKDCKIWEPCIEEQERSQQVK